MDVVLEHLGELLNLLSGLVVCLDKHVLEVLDGNVVREHIHICFRMPAIQLEHGQTFESGIHCLLDYLVEHGLSDVRQNVVPQFIESIFRGEIQCRNWHVAHNKLVHDIGI